MSERLVKLVRDKVSERLIEGANGVCYAPIEDEDLIVDELKKKLAEEVGEYLVDPNVYELADIVEICGELAERELKVTWRDVQIAQAEKYVKNGGFSDGIGMYVERREDADTL